MRALSERPILTRLWLPLAAAALLLLLIVVAVVTSPPVTQVWCDRFGQELVLDADATPAAAVTPGPHWHEVGSGCWTFTGSASDEDAPGR